MPLCIPKKRKLNKKLNTNKNRADTITLSSGYLLDYSVKSLGLPVSVLVI